MTERFLTENIIHAFRKYLVLQEKSTATVIVQNMTLKEHSDSKFDMLVCWPGVYNKGGVHFKNLKLQASNRWVYSPSQNTVFFACKESEIGRKAKTTSRAFLPLLSQESQIPIRRKQTTQ